MSDEQMSIDDHKLFARPTDPVESHVAGASVEEREGTTATFTPNTHKHKILRVYGGTGFPLTDTEAWQGAGLGYRSAGWHRCSDMLDVGAIEVVDTMLDPETNCDVRRCRITDVGRDVLRKLDLGEKVKLT